MAKAKQRPINILRSKTPAMVALDAFIKSINTPRNVGNLTAAFLILFMLLAVPLLVIGTINQRDLKSLAQVPACPSLTSLTDNAAPTVTIENPSEGSYLTGKSLLIEVSAADNICVQKVSLLIDGKLAETFTATPYIYAWDLRAVAAGNHVISARATDATSNISVASVSVFRSAKSFVKP